MRYGFKPERAHYIPSDAIEMKDAESSAVAYLSTPAHGKPVALCFSGKRQKPDSHYRYPSEERRAAAIEEHFASVRVREGWQAKRREEVKNARSADKTLTVPDDGYMSAPAVAAFARQCLKEAFPGQKFSVRSDGSLRVSWTDGPSRAAVERIAKTFAGSYFDGMIDYKGSIYHNLDGRKVRFGTDFVFCERELSREALQIGADALREAYAESSGQEPCTFEEHESKWSTWTEIKANPLFPGSCAGRHADDVELITPEDPERPSRFYRPQTALEFWFDHVRPVAPQPSATLARVTVLGTDGYGNTALEAADGGETGRGYPRQKETPEATHARAAIDSAASELAAIAAEYGLAFDTEAQLFKATEPAAKPVECQVIDLASHLLARANSARRVN